MDIFLKFSYFATIGKTGNHMRKLLTGLTMLAMFFSSQGAYANGSQPLAGVTAVILGESHMSIKGQLITTLPDDMIQLGAKVYAYGACGATPSAWVKKKSAYCSAFRINSGPVRNRPTDIATTQSIGNLITTEKPNLIIVVEGDTMGSYDQKALLKSWIWDEVSALTKEIKSYGTKCVWVGPVWGQEGGKYIKNNVRVKELSDYLSTIVEPCTYIDSLTFSKINEWKTIDGQHLDSEGYVHWAHGITNAITSPEILQSIKR